MRKWWIAGIALTCFWLVMMGLLIYREIIEPASIIKASGKGPSFLAKLPFRQEWMGIYYQDKKVGFSYTTISPAVLDNEDGYNITNRTNLALAMLGEEYSLNLEGFSFVDKLYRLKNFEMRVGCGEHHLELKGQASRDKLLLLIKTSGETFRKEIDIKGESLLANTLTPFYVLPSLSPGRRFSVNLIDPLTLSLGKAEVVVGEEELYLFQGEKRKALAVEVKYQGISTRALISEEGEILREETPLGWVMVKEDRTEALKWARERKENVDLAYAVAIPVAPPIREPEKIRELRLKISGADLDSFSDSRQEVIDKKEGLVIIRRRLPKAEDHPARLGEIEARYKRGDPFIQADNKEIMEKAREIIGDETDPWLKAKRLNQWVYRHIKKEPSLTIPSALEVLKTRQGDCNEHTVLFTALARSAGLASRMAVGLVYLRGYFFYHAWPEVFVGEWISLDPTLGEEVANATHIKLSEGGVEAQTAITRLIGRLKIEVVGYEYD